MKDTANQLMNRKGQALVEFVLLLPVLMFVIFIIVDFATIFYHKNHLEGVINDVTILVEDGMEKNDIIKMINDPKVNYSVTYEGRYATIKLTKDVSLITPFSNFVIDDPYQISSERTILYES